MKKQPIPNNNNKPATKLPPKERIEKDADDLVHEQDAEPAITGEEDPDDLIHQPLKPQPGTIANEDNMEDPDDLVHGYQDDEDEQG